MGNQDLSEFDKGQIMKARRLDQSISKKWSKEGQLVDQ